MIMKRFTLDAWQDILFEQDQFTGSSFLRRTIHNHSKVLVDQTKIFLS